MGAFRRTNSVTLEKTKIFRKKWGCGCFKKRMVRIMGKPISKWMIWGVFPLFLETPMCQKRKGSHNQNGCPKMNRFPLDFLGIPIMSKHISWRERNFHPFILSKKPSEKWWLQSIWTTHSKGSPFVLFFPQAVVANRRQIFESHDCDSMTPENFHHLSRCISYWTWGIFQLVMLVNSGV